MTGHLLVVDGDNAARRYFHVATDRPPEEAFSSALGRYRIRYEPTHAVAVFDPFDNSSNWRRSIWPTYKANRPPRPEGLNEVLLGCRRQCSFWKMALSIPASDHEADDMIATYVAAAVAEGMRVTIVSGDKDLVQLVRDEPVQVRMIDEIRKRTWGPDESVEKFGVPPERIPDLLALIGDTSDNYTGIPGVGSKTAAKLLAEYGTLEYLLERKNLVTSTKVMNLLRAYEDTARTCFQLATLRTDLVLPVPLAGCTWNRR
jgi:5'-3' exonuclease